mgnify:CR=1 FL=1
MRQRCDRELMLEIGLAIFASFAHWSALHPANEREERTLRRTCYEMGDSMARFYPALAGDFHGSTGERQVYRALEMLGDDYTVFHSYC